MKRMPRQFKKFYKSRLHDYAAFVRSRLISQ
jgi:hypothetical protein